MPKKSLTTRSDPGGPTANTSQPGRNSAAADFDFPDSDSPRERVVNDIIRGLYEGRYLPGQRLVEAKLTEYYGISRGPVREALYRLAAIGLVELALQRGGRVRRLTLADAIDILRVVQGLMQIAGALAATRISMPGAAAQLTGALEYLQSFEGSNDSPEYAIARDRYYSTISALAGNAELQRIMPSVQIHLVRVQFRKITQTLDRKRHAGYQQITEAILSGQPARAEKVIRTQFERTTQYLESIRPSSAETVATKSD